MQAKDFKWYLENFKALYERYGNCYISIKNQKVLGAYASCSEAVMETVKTEELGTFIVQQCGPDETAYTNYIASISF